MLDDLELESTVRKGAGQDDYSLSHPHPFPYFLLSLTPFVQISFPPPPLVLKSKIAIIVFAKKKLSTR